MVCNIHFKTYSEYLCREEACDEWTHHHLLLKWMNTRSIRDWFLPLTFISDSKTSLCIFWYLYSVTAESCWWLNAPFSSLTWTASFCLYYRLLRISVRWSIVYDEVFGVWISWIEYKGERDNELQRVSEKILTYGSSLFSNQPGEAHNHHRWGLRSATVAQRWSY